MDRRSFILASLASSLPSVAFADFSRFRERIGRDNRWGETSIKGKSEFQYGPHPLQSLDVYWPSPFVTGKPIVFMVHGGGWKRGDKDSKNIVDNKVPFFHKKGWGFVSTAYRLLPEAQLETQIQDVISSIRFIQNRYPESPLVLMGHSAGAHLVGWIVSHRPDSIKLKPWKGSVLLDSAALDVKEIMERPHFRLYDDPFGSDPVRWKELSPYWVLESGVAPILSIYSNKRDDSRWQSEKMQEKAQSLNVHFKIQGVDLTHGEINQLVGEDMVLNVALDSFFGFLQI
ncbi:MAG TPA: alpha/beta hydrolase [Ignavibacteriaceae bacterium]